MIGWAIAIVQLKLRLPTTGALEGAADARMLLDIALGRGRQRGELLAQLLACPARSYRWRWHGPPGG